MFPLALLGGFTNRCQYVGWSSEDAVKHYLTRISARIPQFQTMEEKDLNYIKVLAICSILVPLLEYQSDIQSRW